MARASFAVRALEAVKDKPDLYTRLYFVLKGTGQIPFSEEDYEMVIGQLREEHQMILRRFGPEDADLMAKYIAAHPDYRGIFQDARVLYRALLEVGGSRGKQVTRPGSSSLDMRVTTSEPAVEHATRQVQLPLAASSLEIRLDGVAIEEPNLDGSPKLLSEKLEDLIRAAPREFFTQEQDAVDAARKALTDLAVKQTFREFEADSDAAMKKLNRLIANEESENLRDVYRAVRRDYQGVLRFRVEGVNPNFRDPRTGETGVLPSLHQRVGIYHIVGEKRFGIFDDMGTGKTFQGALGASMVRRRLADDGRAIHNRYIVLCPNSAKDAWRRGLAGEEHERYFERRQDALILNGGSRREVSDLVGDAEWIVINPEKLAMKVLHEGKLMTLAEGLAALKYDVMIIDEIHNLRNTKDDAVYSNLARLLTLQLDETGDFRPLIGLSGTPIPDSMEDYSMIGHLLEPKRYSTPESFDREYQQDPRSISTVLGRRSIRRRSEDVTKLEAMDKEYHSVELGDIQRLIYEGIVGNKGKYRSWLIQARKALLDPRLVDPVVLRDLGVLGHVSEADASKYYALEDMVVDAVGHGNKFVVFSSMFKEGVTRFPERLEARYREIGREDLFAPLGFGTKQDPRLLQARLEAKLLSALGESYKIGIIDGEVSANGRGALLSDRELVIRSFREDKSHIGNICTTETAKESLDFTNATWGFFLDEDYSPVTSDQGEKRLHRKGQSEIVHIRYLAGRDTLDEAIRKYVDRKRLIIQIAVDGYPLTDEEKSIISNRSRLRELQKNMGGESQNLLGIEYGEGDFTATVLKRRPRGTRIVTGNDYETTNAQLLRRMIAPFVNQGVGWNDPKLVALYTTCVHELSIYALHRARMVYLMSLAKKGEISWPEKVLAEGSGPSLLFNALRDLEDMIGDAGLALPEVWDRDLAENMLAAGNNPHQIVGDMRGRESTIGDATYDLVDHESISLLRYSGDIKEAVLETSRILKPEGYVLYGAKDIQFADSFYEGLEEAGLLVLSERGAQLSPSKDFLDRVQQSRGLDYATKLRRKLLNSHFILAQKVAEPKDSIDERLFVLEHSRTAPKARGRRRSRRSEDVVHGTLSNDRSGRVTPYWVDDSGSMRFEDRLVTEYEKRPREGRLYTVDGSGVVQFL